MPRHHMGPMEKPRKGTLMRIVKDVFKKFKWQFLLVLFCLFLNVLSNTISPVLIAEITSLIEGVLTTKGDAAEYPATQMTFIIVAVSLVYVVGLFANLIKNINIACITQRYLNSVRIKMFDHMQTLPIRYFDTHKHGDIMSVYTNDTDTMRQLVYDAIPMTFQTAVTVIVLLVIMLYYSVILTAVVLCAAGLMFIVTKKLGGKAAKYFMSMQKNIGQVEGAIEEDINGVKVIKSFCHEEESQKAFSKINDELNDVATKGAINGNILGPTTANIGNLMYVSIAAIGVLMIIFKFNWGFINILKPESATIGYAIVLAFLNASRMFTNNVNSFAQDITYIVMSLAGADRVLKLIDEPEERDSGDCGLVNAVRLPDGSVTKSDVKTGIYAWERTHSDGTLEYIELKGDIVLEHVDFGYNPDKMILHDVSIYAKPGQRIALVGPTGAGKTTITNLLNRFYYIDGGKIRYDGINITKLKKADLRKSLGMVLQDTSLFTGTVMENIRYGRLDATDEEVYEAAKIANAYDFITRLPEGFNTMLTGDGANLSQGQRQLLSIARAACADAPVMILDEATSSIDTRTEKLVQDGMDRLMEGRTVFIIAHRLSTIQNANAIMVIEDGRIIERGDHEELIKQHGKYYQLYTGGLELE